LILNGHFFSWPNFKGNQEKEPGIPFGPAGELLAGEGSVGICCGKIKIRKRKNHFVACTEVYVEINNVSVLLGVL